MFERDGVNPSKPLLGNPGILHGNPGNEDLPTGFWYIMSDYTLW
jgi:hypothetical protein